MGAAVVADSTALRVAAATGLAVLLLVGISSLLGGLAGCQPADHAASSDLASQTIPADYLTLYRNAGRAFHVPWAVLAAIGAIESDHGRSTAPGVHSGVNAAGCCAGRAKMTASNVLPADSNNAPAVTPKGRPPHRRDAVARRAFTAQRSTTSDA